MVFSYLLLIYALASIPHAVATEPREMLPEKIAWVGLANGKMLGWLNNLNVIDDLCPQPDGTFEAHECRSYHTQAARLLVIPVYAAASQDSERIGELVVVGHPGQKLQLHASTQGIAEPFLPDLFLGDWGYGPPYFHLTILSRIDTWFRVPIASMGAGWINSDDWISDSSSGPHIEILQATDGRVITTPHGDLIVLAIEKDRLLVRPEQKQDMWCQSGEPPPLVPGTEFHIPLRELVSESGNLLIRYKYMKGC